MKAPMWSFVISSLVYIAAFWAASAYLKNIGLEPGSSKSILCGCFAFALSWLAGSAVDWAAPAPPPRHQGQAREAAQTESPEDADTASDSDRKAEPEKAPRAPIDMSALEAAAKALK